MKIIFNRVVPVLRSVKKIALNYNVLSISTLKSLSSLNDLLCSFLNDLDFRLKSIFPQSTIIGWKFSGFINTKLLSKYSKSSSDVYSSNFCLTLKVLWNRKMMCRQQNFLKRYYLSIETNYLRKYQIRLVLI